jgi:hypothetical protein
VHTVTATAADASTDTATVTITVAAANPPNLANAAAQTYTTTVSATFSFTNTGASVQSCSIAPALPGGLGINTNLGTCRINGTPSAAQTATVHTITGYATDGSSDAATVTITVNTASPPIIANITPALALTKDEAMTPASFTNTGSAATSCSSDPTLPTGIAVGVDISTCRLTGTPTGTQSSQSYTITATAADGSSDTATVSISVTGVMTCPTGYIVVPEYTDDDTGTVPAFCVMKYEAKDVGGVPTSQPTLLPWRDIARGMTSSTTWSAWKACKDLSATGYTFDLISNSQWQSIARQIERYEVAGSYINWQNNSNSGDNAINRGASDVINRLAADANDANGCTGTSTPIDCSGTWHLNKRTHTLPNGQVIWDFAGNVAEWVRDNSPFNYGFNALWYTVLASSGTLCSSGSGCTGPQGRPKAAFGPFGDYTAKTTAPYGGLGIGETNYSHGAIVRGGAYDYGTWSGIFTTQKQYSSSSTDDYIGFRCVAIPD